MTARRIAVYVKFVLELLAIVAIIVAVAYVLATPLHAQSHPADQSYLQTAGHALSGTTTFATDLFVTNATGDPVDISILFKPVNSPMSWMVLPNRIHLGPHEYKELVDPLPSFGITGIGMLIFNPCLSGADCSAVIDQTSNPHAPRYIEHSSNYREVSISARIYSYVGTPASGTRGESYPALPWYDVASIDGAAAGLDRSFITGIRATGHWRTNINVANASEFSATEIVATLYDGLGVSRGVWSASLNPLDNRQIAAEDMFPVLRESRFNRQPPVLNPWVRFEQIAVVPTADAAAYGCASGCPGFLVQGSMIDSLSGDAVRLVAQFEKVNQSSEVAAAQMGAHAIGGSPMGSVVSSANAEPARGQNVPRTVADRQIASTQAWPATSEVLSRPARIADVLRFTFKGPQCSIEPIASGYLVRKPNGAPLADIGVGELAGVMEMCGAATSGGAQ
jgi:hypothetical protein